MTFLVVMTVVVFLVVVGDVLGLGYIGDRLLGARRVVSERQAAMNARPHGNVSLIFDRERKDGAIVVGRVASCSPSREDAPHHHTGRAG